MCFLAEILLAIFNTHTCTEDQIIKNPDIMDLQEKNFVTGTHETNQPGSLCISLSHTALLLNLFLSTLSRYMKVSQWQGCVYVSVLDICFRQPYSTVHWKLVLCFTCTWFTGCDSLSLDLWASFLSWCYQELYHHRWLRPFVQGLDIWFCAAGPAH